MSPDQAMAVVARIDCPVDDWDWPFARAQAARIDAHWEALRREKPRLFNGRVLMSRRLSLDTEALALRGAAHEVDYKAFLAWRDFGFPDGEVHNVFAMPALRAADGPFLLGRMSAGTANAGRLYFPAGTPERADIGPDGRIDFDGSILRELEEETGIVPDAVEREAHWTIVFAGPLVACMKVVRSPLPAAALQAQVRAFVAAQSQPELDDLVAIGREADIEMSATPTFMLTYLRAALAAP